MTNDLQILVDSDAFIGWMIEYDAHHQTATRIFEQLLQDKSPLATTNWVVAETATVLSHRAGQKLAKIYLDEVIEQGQFPVVRVDDRLERSAFRIFKGQTKKGTSVVDCANVAVIRQLHIPQIFSFDQVYPKKFKLSTVSVL